MVQANRPIGLYDSGIGGLSVVREVFRQLPGESVLYFGDTARVPYGPRPAHEILAFNHEIVAMLLDAGAKAILIACNTSSALALADVQARCPVPVIGLIEPGAEAAIALGNRIGVMATEGTVSSGAYGRALRRSNPTVSVQEVACPTLVPLVESGDWEGPEAEAIVRAALEPFAAHPPECLVLGCTHYPLLAPAIRRVLGPTVALIDPAARAAAAMADALKGAGLLGSGLPEHRFLTSGDPGPFYELAGRLFPGHVGRVARVPMASRMATPAAGT